GYYNGKQAYEAWIKGLSEDAAFDITNDKDNTFRRLGVNNSMLFNLIDARRSAEKYLRDSASLLSGNKQKQLIKIADNYKLIYKELSDFYVKIKFDYEEHKAYNALNTLGVETHELRQEQIELLSKVLKLEEVNAELAKSIFL
ncbi:MAG: hypothetical protein LBI03_08380, partial [Clostridiales bacterium]|nr:hypothetical protein [Clostridiales bacterium]